MATFVSVYYKSISKFYKKIPGDLGTARRVYNKEGVEFELIQHYVISEWPLNSSDLNAVNKTGFN